MIAVPPRRLVLVGIVAFVAAIAGVFVGRSLAEAPKPSESELHAVLHDKIRLTAAQETQLAQIEAQFAGRRRMLEAEMRTANVRLAQAIEAEHGYGPRVTAAIAHVHVVMGALQKDTLEHLFAMRAILDQDQARVFDTTVVKALTADAQ